MTKNKAAQALAKLAAGKPKKFTQEEIEKRKERLELARERRWPKKNNNIL